MDTRQKSAVYLLGAYEPEILGAKLPSYRQAFGFFMYLHKVEKKTIRDASHGAIQAVTALWNKAGIPVRASQHCIKKLEDVYQEWKGLQKHNSRTSESQKQNEETFVGRLEDLFDIAHANALDLITNPEDRAFLLCQRQKGRPGSIGGLDLIYMQRQLRSHSRLEAENRRLSRSENEIANMSSQVELISASSSQSSATDDDDIEYHKDADPPGAVGHVSAPKKVRTNVMTPELSSTLDRTQISSRKATFIIGEVASSLGHNISTLNISRNTIHRAREDHRGRKAKKLKAEFSAAVPLIVHWDGKLLEDLTSRKHVDRLPVLVSGVGIEQLLGVPNLDAGTGVAQANAIFDCLERWDVVHHVAGLCFDTTPSNTGKHSGTCRILEQKLGKDLLFLACRHHIMELIVGSVFDKAISGSTGPDILLFKRFRDSWMSIDNNKYQPASTDSTVEAMVSPYRNDILDFAKTHLNEIQPRDDYREFLELSVVFLGGVPPKGIRFYLPGAMHRARWMAKVLYAIKMWLFRGQFKMTVSELKGMRDLAVFAVIVHLKSWIKAPLAVEAPLNDYLLMRELLNYPQEGISTASSKKLGLHLWYLSEELVTLCLFDSRIPPESKSLMIAAMDEEAPENPPKCPRVGFSAFSNDRGLEQFFTTNSRKLFSILSLPDDFLRKNPAEWEEEESYKVAAKTVMSLGVTNDRAERGVALIQELNKKLTQKEDQLQYLVQVVADHRKQFPAPTKRTMNVKQAKSEQH